MRRRMSRPGPSGSRRALRVAVSVSLLALLATVAPAEAMTGSEWQKLTPAARAGYVDGVIDAWVGLVLVQESLGNKDAGITVFAEVDHLPERSLVGHEQDRGRGREVCGRSAGFAQQGHARHRLRRPRALLPLAR